MKYKTIIRCVQGPDKGKKWRWVFALSTTVVIGRLKGCHIQLTDTGVSQSHCLLQIQNNLLCIVDMGSLSGTFVNDNLISGAANLKNGDHLTLGKTKLLITISGISGLPLHLPEELVTQPVEQIPKQQELPQISSEITHTEVRSLPKTINRENKEIVHQKRCSFCNSRDDRLQKIQKYHYCNACQSTADCWYGNLSQYPLEGVWHTSHCGNVLLSKIKDKKVLIYISRIGYRELPLNIGEEFTEVSRQNFSNMYPVIENRKCGEHFVTFLPYRPGYFLGKPPERLTALESIHFISEISKGLYHTSQNWGLHGEISLENIFIEACQKAYLLGYGMVRDHYCRCDRKNPARRFRAPERLAQKSPPTITSEIFSLAACLYLLLTGHRVYGETNPKQIVQEMAFSPSCDIFPGIARKFFEKSLAAVAKERYSSFTQFIDALSMVKCLYNGAQHER